MELVNINLLKLLFAILTGYLLATECLFFLSMPTYTTSYKEHFSQSHYPDIKTCTYPPFNIENLEKQGYKNPESYNVGIINETFQLNKIGWQGVNNETVAEILKDVSTFKSPKDCPLISTRSKDGRSYLKASLTRPTFLNGRCCHSEIQKKDDIPGWKELRIQPKRRMMNTSYQVFLSDKQSANHPLTNKFNMLVLTDYFRFRNSKSRNLFPFIPTSAISILCPAIFNLSFIKATSNYIGLISWPFTELFFN